MKQFVKISLYPEGVCSACGDRLTAKQINDMKKRWPEFFPSDLVGFHLRAELKEPVIAEVIDYLRSTGREPHWMPDPRVPWAHPTLYQIDGERVWEPSDSDQASYFRWLVKTEAGKGKKLPPDGTFEVEFSSYRGKPIGIIQNYWNPICSVEYRKELEAQNFKGLAFRPVGIKSRKPEKLVLWQPWSSITLPPVLNEVSKDEDPFNPAKTTGCGVSDIYFPPHYRFPAAKVAKLEPFDIALTSEHWGGGVLHAREPAIIVSRRFRDWFMTQKVPVEWWPVALE